MTTEYPHRVPVGATIPAGVEFVETWTKYGDSTLVTVGPQVLTCDDVQQPHDPPTWTANPLSAPTPKEGAPND